MSRRVYQESTVRISWEVHDLSSVDEYFLEPENIVVSSSLDGIFLYRVKLASETLQC